MKSLNTTLFSFLGIALFILTGCGPKYTIEEQDGISIIHNKGGKSWDMPQVRE